MLVNRFIAMLMASADDPLGLAGEGAAPVTIEFGLDYVAEPHLYHFVVSESTKFHYVAQQE